MHPAESCAALSGTRYLIKSSEGVRVWARRPRESVCSRRSPASMISDDDDESATLGVFMAADASVPALAVLPSAPPALAVAPSAIDDFNALVSSKDAVDAVDAMMRLLESFLRGDAEVGISRLSVVLCVLTKILNDGIRGGPIASNLVTKCKGLRTKHPILILAEVFDKLLERSRAEPLCVHALKCWVLVFLNLRRVTQRMKRAFEARLPRLKSLSEKSRSILGGKAEALVRRYADYIQSVEILPGFTEDAVADATSFFELSVKVTTASSGTKRPGSSAGGAEAAEAGPKRLKIGGISDGGAAVSGVSRSAGGDGAGAGGAGSSTSRVARAHLPAVAPAAHSAALLAQQKVHAHALAQAQAVQYEQAIEAGKAAAAERLASWISRTTKTSSEELEEVYSDAEFDSEEMSTMFGIIDDLDFTRSTSRELREGGSVAQRRALLGFKRHALMELPPVETEDADEVLDDTGGAGASEKWRGPQRSVLRVLRAGIPAEPGKLVLKGHQKITLERYERAKLRDCQCMVNLNKRALDEYKLSVKRDGDQGATVCFEAPELSNLTAGGGRGGDIFCAGTTPRARSSRGLRVRFADGTKSEGAALILDLLPPSRKCEPPGHSKAPLRKALLGMRDKEKPPPAMGASEGIDDFYTEHDGPILDEVGAEPTQQAAPVPAIPRKRVSEQLGAQVALEAMVATHVGVRNAGGGGVDGDDDDGSSMEFMSGLIPSNDAGARFCSCSWHKSSPSQFWPPQPPPPAAPPIQGSTENIKAALQLAQSVLQTGAMGSVGVGVGAGGISIHAAGGAKRSGLLASPPESCVGVGVGARGISVHAAGGAKRSELLALPPESSPTGPSGTSPPGSSRSGGDGSAAKPCVRHWNRGKMPCTEEACSDDHSRSYVPGFGPPSPAPSEVGLWRKMPRPPTSSMDRLLLKDVRVDIWPPGLVPHFFSDAGAAPCKIPSHQNKSGEPGSDIRNCSRIRESCVVRANTSEATSQTHSPYPHHLEHTQISNNVGSTNNFT